MKYKIDNSTLKKAWKQLKEIEKYWGSDKVEYIKFILCNVDIGDKQHSPDVGKMAKE